MDLDWKHGLAWLSRPNILKYMSISNNYEVLSIDDTPQSRTMKIKDIATGQHYTLIMYPTGFHKEIVSENLALRAEIAQLKGI